MEYKLLILSFQIIDYASKHWSGLVSGYFKPRWALFLKELIHSLETNAKFDQNKFNHDVFTQVEDPFTHQKGVHLVEKAQSEFIRRVI